MNLRQPRRTTAALSSTRGLSVASVVAVLLGLLLLAAPAFAVTSTRNFDTQITGSVPPNAPVQGPFREESNHALAVDPAGNLWSIDVARQETADAGTISEYDSSGGYLSEIATDRAGVPGIFVGSSGGIAVDNSSGDLYVSLGSLRSTGEGTIEVFNPTNGHLLAEYPSSSGGPVIAVDNSGGSGAPGEGQQGRYYTSGELGQIEAFEANGDEHDFEAHEPYIHGNEITGTAAPADACVNNSGYSGILSVGPQGEIYVHANRGGGVCEFRPSGEFVREISAEGFGGDFYIGGLAVDPTNGHLLVGNRLGALYEFDSSGNFLGQVSLPEAFGGLLGQGIAFNSADYLYVAGASATGYLVDVFLPPGLGPLPEATAEAATEVHRTTATLHATAALGGGAKITKCRFEYLPAANYQPWADEAPRYSAGHNSGTAPCLNEEGHEVGTESNPIEAETKIHADAHVLAGTASHYRVSLANAGPPTPPRYGADENSKPYPRSPISKPPGRPPR